MHYPLFLALLFATVVMAAPIGQIRKCLQRSWMFHWMANPIDQRTVEEDNTDIFVDTVEPDRTW